MTHVFLSPHPDDVALASGGLVTSLRELGARVAGPGGLPGYAQRHWATSLP